MRAIFFFGIWILIATRFAQMVVAKDNANDLRFADK